MQEVRKIPNEILIGEDISESRTPAIWTSYLPAILATGGAFLMLGLRVQIGETFIADQSLMMLALACYILAALFQLTNLYASSEMARKIGLWSATLGVFFNLSSWLVRWVNTYHFEMVQM
nr:hypothetical protein [Acidobacteriota bacterium]